MGRRGPRPTPTKILKARGSWRAELNKAEPHVESEVLPCPTWLSPEAKDYWKVLIPELVELKLIGRIDSKALERYCQAWAEYRDAKRFLQKNGPTYEIKKKGKLTYVAQYPQVSISKNLSSEMLRFEQEFGLTAAARSRVQANIETKAAPPAREAFEPIRLAE